MDSQDLYLLMVVVLMRACAGFPSARLEDFLVTAIARSAYHLSRHKRRLISENVEAALASQGLQGGRQPGLGRHTFAHRRQEIVKGAFHGFWHDTFSLLWHDRKRAALERTEVCGLEHLHGASAAGRGAILWECATMGSRNAAKQVLHGRGIAVHQIHAEYHLGGGFAGAVRSPTWVRRHVVSPFFERRERRFVAEVVQLPRSGSLAFARKLQSRLREKAILCVSADGEFGQKLVPVRFLGRNRLFPTGMVSLARLSGAPLLPVFCIRAPTGGLRLIIEPPIETRGGGGREEDPGEVVARYVRLLESYVRKYPEQYWGWHRLGGSGERAANAPKGPGAGVEG